MRVFKVRVIALVALVVAALGVTVANARSRPDPPATVTSGS